MFPVFNSNRIQNQSKAKYRVSTEQNERSFHIQRQTFYHNNFKKLKPSEIRLKQNHINFDSITCKQWNKLRQKKQQDYKCNKNRLVQLSMRNKKKILQTDINDYFLKVNQSFNRYLLGKNNQDQALNQLRKKTLSCKNILKELTQMQSAKKFNLPLVSVNQKNILQASLQTNYEICHLENNCLDSLFPFERYGPSLSNYQNQLVVYGGFTAGKKPIVSCFHKYNLQKGQWTKIQQTPSNLGLIPCFHTIDVYKNYLILVGGMSMSPQLNGKRKFNTDISIYNFDKKQWIKLRSSLAIRSHASTLFGNTLLIHGGIDQRQSNSNQMHFINFNPNSIQNSILLSTQNRLHHSTDLPLFKHNLSHHKIINTNEVQNNAKMLLKYDGVFCFGGINDEGQMHNEITFLNCIGKQNALDVRFQSWIYVQLIGRGPKPEARKNHSLNIINKRALMLLIGGENIKGQILSDMWIFDLVKLQWKQISPLSKPLQEIMTDPHFIRTNNLDQGISGHCTTFIGSKLYIFGGKREAENKKENSLWFIETDVINNMNKKLKIEKSIGTSINTIKQSKSESMWDIQY